MPRETIPGMDAKALNETPIQKLEREYRELHPRSTPTQAYRELAMAYATKQAQRGSDSTEYGTAATGDRFGMAYLKSLNIVREEGETADEYRARKHDELKRELDMLTSLNAGKIERDLKAVKP